MKKQLNPFFCLTTLGLASLLGTGCKTILRENIVSSIDTGFGATVMENKQTQVPEIKVGYIRTQFYSVPTGKVVENDRYRVGYGTNGVVQTYSDHQTNAANVTPNMVAGIYTKSGFQSLIFGLQISENFAVGEAGVKSDAATAMYVANAKDPASANAAAAAVRTLPPGVMSVQTEKDSASAYKQYKVAATADAAKVDAVIAAVTDRTNMVDLIKNGEPEDWNTVIPALKNRKLIK